MANLKTVVLALGALCVTSPASPAPVHRMTGIKWEVVTGEGVCRLESRIVGGEFAGKVIIAGTPGVSPLSEIGINPLMQPKPGKMFTVAYSVNGEAPKQAKLLPRDGRKDPQNPLFVRMRPADQIRAIMGESILLGFANGEVVQVETDGIAAADKALQACNNTAMSKALKMPIDLSLIAPTKLMADHMALRGVMTPDDYPDEALMKGAVGRVTFLVGIDKAGRVPSCVVLESSGSDALDRRTCEVMKRRAKLTPRADAAGARVNGVMISSISFWVEEVDDPMGSEWLSSGPML